MLYGVCDAQCVRIIYLYVLVTHSNLSTKLINARFLVSSHICKCISHYTWMAALSLLIIYSHVMRSCCGINGILNHYSIRWTWIHLGMDNDGLGKWSNTLWLAVTPIIIVLSIWFRLFISTWFWHFVIWIGFRHLYMYTYWTILCIS